MVTPLVSLDKVLLWVLAKENASNTEMPSNFFMYVASRLGSCGFVKTTWLLHKTFFRGGNRPVLQLHSMKKVF